MTMASTRTLTSKAVWAVLEPHFEKQDQQRLTLRLLVVSIFGIGYSTPEAVKTSTGDDKRFFLISSVTRRELLAGCSITLSYEGHAHHSTYVHRTRNSNVITYDQQTRKVSLRWTCEAPANCGPRLRSPNPAIPVNCGTWLNYC